MHLSVTMELFGKQNWGDVDPIPVSSNPIYSINFSLLLKIQPSTSTIHQPQYSTHVAGLKLRFLYECCIIRLNVATGVVL